MAKGVEQQTRKLMEVCRMRNTPVIIYVNKMDREGRDPFELLDELEDELKNFDWAVANMCDTNTLLSTEEDTTWRKCVTMLDSRYWLWLNCPTSPHLN